MLSHSFKNSLAKVRQRKKVDFIFVFCERTSYKNKIIPSFDVNEQAVMAVVEIHFSPTQEHAVVVVRQLSYSYDQILM